MTLWRIPCPWAMTAQFQLNFYFRFSRRNFFLYYSMEWWKSSFPWPPKTRGQGIMLCTPAHGAVLWRPSLISAEATEQNYQQSILQVLLPYRCRLSKAKLKRISLRIAKDISVHQAFSLSNLKVLLQIPEVWERFLHIGGRAPVSLA